MAELSDIHKYYKDRIGEVKDYVETGHSWVFLMLACYIEFLVKMVNNIEETNHNHYKKFIREYLAEIDPQYKDFIYSNGKSDLPEQMYHVLRCGIVHGYSLVPDKISISKGGRKRSILLGHRKNCDTHFEKNEENGLDSVVFTAEDFAEDLEKLTDAIFKEMAPKDQNLSKNIVDWYSKYPPIVSLKN